MNDHEPQPDARESAEARRTACALGELADAQRRETEREWENDPAGRREAESLAGVARWLKQAMVAAFSPPSDAPSTVRAAVEAKLAEQASPVVTTTASVWLRLLQTPRRRRLAFAAGAAACLALLAVPASLVLRAGRGDLAVEPAPVGGDAGLRSPFGPTVAVAPLPPHSPDAASAREKTAQTRNPAPGASGLANVVAETSNGGSPVAKNPPSEADAAIAARNTVGSPPAHAADVAVGSTPGPRTDPAEQDRIASRRLRGGILLNLLAASDRAKWPTGGAPDDPKAAFNLPPHVPKAAPTPQRRVQEYPFVSTVDGRSGVFPLHLQGDSYARVRDCLRGGSRPPASEVWPEEFVSHFPYEDAKTDRAPLGVVLEAARCPWNVQHMLARVTLHSAGAPGGEPAVLGAGPGPRGLMVTLSFPPKTVARYRLIACGDLPGVAARTGTVPADSRGWPPGRTVTALYELELHEVATLSEMDDPSRRAKPQRPAEPAKAKRRLLSLELRCDSAAGRPPISEVHGLDESGKRFEEASSDFRFAASAAAFAMILRDSPHRGSIDLKTLEPIAADALGSDPGGDRAEMLALIRAARSLGVR